MSDEQSSSSSSAPQPQIQNEIKKDMNFEYRQFQQNPIKQGEDNEPIRPYRMMKRAPAQVYYCDICDKNIKYPSKINEHIRQHTGEKAHRCGFCGQCFSQGHSLKSHLVSHMNERPYKCSYCSASFLSVQCRKSHEKSHLQENTEYIEVIAEGEQQMDQNGHEAACEVFECPYNCGFQSYVENEVLDHIDMEHEQVPPNQQYEVDNLCWQEQIEPDGTVHMVQMHRNHRTTYPESKENKNYDGILVEESFNDPEEMYEYIYEDNYTEEVISQDSQNHGDVASSSNSILPDSQENNSQELIPGTSEMMYEQEDVEHEEYTGNIEAPLPLNEVEVETSSENLIENAMFEEEKIDVGSSGKRMASTSSLKQPSDHMHVVYKPDLVEEHVEKFEEMAPNHLYGQIIMDDIVQVVGDDEDERVRVVVHPNPPKRGTKSAKDWEKLERSMQEVVVEASTLEMAAPVRHLQQGYFGASRKRRRPTKTPRNLDWIIEAVSKGVDVNTASPHQRRKPLVHKCEFCGKVDKYPSKIQAHMRTHTGEKPFKCEICGMTFAQKTPMRLHLRRHFDQKPYACLLDGCKERFVSGALLKAHVEKKHLNKKKYVCFRGCGRVFSSAYNQRVHEQKCVQTNYANNVGEYAESEPDADDIVEQYHDDVEDYLEDQIAQIGEEEPLDEQPGDELIEAEPVFLHHQ